MFKEVRNIALAGLAATAAACSQDRPPETEGILRMEIQSSCKPGQEERDGRLIAEELRPFREAGYSIPGGYGLDSSLVQALADSYRDCTPGDFREAREILLEESLDTRYVDYEILRNVTDAVGAGRGRSYVEIDLREKRED